MAITITIINNNNTRHAIDEIIHNSITNSIDTSNNTTNNNADNININTICNTILYANNTRIRNNNKNNNIRISTMDNNDVYKVMRTQQPSTATTISQATT